MRRTRLLASLLIAALALLVAGRTARAQSGQAALTIGGMVAHPLSLTPRDLAWLPPAQLGSACADGTQHVYAGVDLAGVLAAAGLQGADPLQSYINVTGADGHSVLIAWEEIDRLAGQHPLTGPLLALDRDGAPLAESGPIKLVWDGCPTARDVNSVQSITVGTFAPSAAAPALPQSIDRAAGLASVALGDGDLPGMTPRYFSLNEGASNAALPVATFRGFWSADGSTARAIDSLRAFGSVDVAQAAFATLPPRLLSLAFGCTPDNVQDAGPRGVGDGDDASSWHCVDAFGNGESFYADVFLHGRVVVTVIAVDPPGDGAETVTAWAHTIDARLGAL